MALAADALKPPTYYKIISLAFKGFLPAASVGYTLYRFCVNRTLCQLEATLEKTFLWLSSCLVGALDNLTFDTLPLQRLTPHDLTQPGALVSLVIIIFIIFVIAIGQVWALRLEGRLLQIPHTLLVSGGLFTGPDANPKYESSNTSLHSCAHISSWDSLADTAKPNLPRTPYWPLY